MGKRKSRSLAMVVAVVDDVEVVRYCRWVVGGGQSYGIVQQLQYSTAQYHALRTTPVAISLPARRSCVSRCWSSGQCAAVA